MTVELSYADLGPRSAPVLVLLHGMGEAVGRASWDPVVPLLRDDFRVVLPDLRGHGRSPRPGSYLLQEMAEDVVALLDGLDIEKVTVVGHSMGGAVALVLTYWRPDLVERLVLVDAPPPRAQGMPGFDAALPAAGAGATEYDLEIRTAIQREIMRPSPGWALRVGTFQAPTLVIGGGPSSEVDQHALQDLTDAIPHSTWTTIDAGHHLHAARPEELVAVLRGWFDQLPVG